MIREFKVERQDSDQSLPYPPRSIVATADGTTWKVLALSSSGAERVLSQLDGPAPGSRRIATPRELRLVAGAPPKEAPEAPTIAPPSGGSRVRDANGKVTTVPGPPTVVEGDFKPEMFPHMQRGSMPIVLENGPHHGAQVQTAIGAQTYELAAPHPDPSSGLGFAGAIYKKAKGRADADGFPVFVFDSYRA